MIYHRIALNTILPLLTYSHPEPLPLGARVVVRLNGKRQVGIVWQSAVAPDYDENKILPIEQILADDFRLHQAWREMLDFTARYYHYPLGQTVFTALPAALKKMQAIHLPTESPYYSLNDLGRAQTPPPSAHTKKHALWHALSSGSLKMEELKKITSNALRIIQEYLEKQWLSISDPPHFPIESPPYLLNDAQNQAVQTVAAHWGNFRPFLLYGITGSGKTEVYFQLMAQALARGEQVLFLLPEINLTPQLLQRINARFPNIPIAILHSQTALSQRAKDYLRALCGQAKLIVGTRLAVFTPLQKLGLIVVDEEHDSSFKQDNDLRYHARDLAIWRAQQAHCPIVLGSATPSLESWHKAQNGAYTLLRLTQRAHQSSTLPEVHILDTNRLTLNNGFSPQVLQLLQKNHQHGGLSLVYLNRRGFAPALFCGDCGHIFSCPNCSAKMVLHQRARQLRCHHCDFRQPIARECPQCGNQDLSAVGQGTQRIEETLRAAIPSANIVRVDRDSVSGKQDWADLYQRIRHDEVDILIGTQMLAKGHDFARLNVVVVLNADGSLFSSDFRAPEHLFAELMQVSGRAGRADERGLVLIQSRLPEHFVFQAMRVQDYPMFATHELSQRQLFDLPPFSFQAAIRADAPEMMQAIEFLNDIRDVVAQMLPEEVSQMGAVPMLMARVARRERAQIFVESPNRKALHHALGLWRQMLNQHRTHAIRWHIDVDVQDM